MTSLIPIDYPLPPGTVFRTPSSVALEIRPDIVTALDTVAAELATSMATPHACIDVGLINGIPGAVEVTSPGRKRPGFPSTDGHGRRQGEYVCH